MKDVFIGLGSNLGDSVRTLESAIEAINALPHTTLIKVSRFYRSQAVGPGEQPDYINAAAHIRTAMTPESLLDRLQQIEHDHQRIRSRIRWTARTLDLDILLYGNQIIQSKRLMVPHPHIAERNFVLLPLHDLAPNLIFPNGVCLIDLVKQTPQTGIELIADLPAWLTS